MRVSRSDARGSKRARVLDAVAIRLGRAAGWAARTSRRGSGSSLPGVVAEMSSPGFIRRRCAAVCDDVLVVSGTNGKTTTASMLRAILDASGIPTIGNATGANLRQGVATSLVTDTGAARTAVFEVDEAALPGVVRDVEPRVLVLTNVFRDQLDRYGETERVVALLRDACRLLPRGAKVVANVDDPILWPALEGHHVSGFGVTLREDRSPEPSLAAEPAVCPRCGDPLVQMSRTIAHLGTARCSSCGWRSTEPAYVGNVVRREGLRSVTLEVAETWITLPTGGIHNVYNALAAIAASDALGIPMSTAARALRSYRPRFGRGEELRVHDRPLWLALMKNPGSADVLIDEIVDDPDVGSVVVSVNDAAADGRDVSWIWDIALERLTSAGLPMIASGTRASDVSVRLKYSDAPSAPQHRDPRAAIAAAMAACPAGRSPVVLATYTAMLDVRSVVTGRTGSLEDLGV